MNEQIIPEDIAIEPSEVTSSDIYFNLQQWLDLELWGNTYRNYVVAGLLFIALLLAFYIFRKQILSYVQKLSEKTASKADDIAVAIFETIKAPFYYFVAFFISIQTLTIQEDLRRWLGVILILWITHQVIQAVEVLIATIITNKAKAAPMGLFTFIAKIILWLTALLMILSNLGVDISSLITGLGIGGIAIALAVQNILGDLFSYFAIHFDRPFSVGDFVVVGQTRGTVKKIGVRTTRVQSLQGEEVVVPNKEITSVQLQNYKKLQRRRVSFNVGIVYESTLTKVKKVPEIVAQAFEGIENIEFNRCHFISMGPSSLDYEIVYHVDNSEYEIYLEANQKILLNMKQLFDKHKISFAYPTQTIHLVK